MLQGALPDHYVGDFKMPNYSRMFRVIHVDPTTGHAVWTELAGARTALERDGCMIAATEAASRPRQWIDERSYVDPEFARAHPIGRGI